MVRANCVNTDQERDTESGLLYFEARYYRGTGGRFTQPDPLSTLIAGPEFERAAKRSVAFHLSNPQNLNLYQYALNNPLRYRDPDGQIIPLILAVGFVAWQVAEASLTAYDVYQAANTLADPNATLGEKGIAVGGAALGLVAPGGGYGTIARKGSKALGSVDDLTRSLKKADELAGHIGDGIRFGQKGISATFQHGEFTGKAIEEVVMGLRSGTIRAEQLPIAVINRNGATYTLNNRSLMALRQAGLEPAIIKDVTGNGFFERQLTERLAELGGRVSDDFAPFVRGGTGR